MLARFFLRSGAERARRRPIGRKKGAARNLREKTERKSKGAAWIAREIARFRERRGC